MRQTLSERDKSEILAHGMTVEEAQRQLDLLRSPPTFLTLDRPCTVGDGIVELSPELRSRARDGVERVIESGRCMHFIPASGAASRMFRDQIHFWKSGEELVLDRSRGRQAERETAETRRFLENLTRFAFADDLEESLGFTPDPEVGLHKEGWARQVLDCLFSNPGLDLGACPKGLLKFHSYRDGSRTAFEEHLVEAVELVRDRHRLCRLHFTVSQEHLKQFESLAGRVVDRLERLLDVRYRIEFTVQEQATDTLALDPGGQVAREDDGRLLFRPGGHGALLRNLQQCGGEFLLVKNIDNVAAEGHKEDTIRVGKDLLGLAADLQHRQFRILDRLEEQDDDGAIDDAVAFLGELLPLAPSSRPDRRALRNHLDRPIRICGMVPNTGEPGGGPFWVRGGDGLCTKQIVEGSHVSADSEEQLGIFGRGTHFNPVFMALAVRDREGRPYRLDPFVDSKARLVTKKSASGRDLTVLEHPGLWNGGMAGWLTLFVAVPIGVFNPVKSVNDLLRREHQSA